MALLRSLTLRLCFCTVSPPRHHLPHFVHNTMQQVLIRMPTAGGAKASGPLLQQLAKSLETEGAQLASKIKVRAQCWGARGGRELKKRYRACFRHFGGLRRGGRQASSAYSSSPIDHAWKFSMLALCPLSHRPWPAGARVPASIAPWNRLTCLPVPPTRMMAAPRA